MEAADETNSPVIMQGSAGARKYAGSNFLRHMILAAIDEFPVQLWSRLVARTWRTRA